MGQEYDKVSVAVDSAKVMTARKSVAAEAPQKAGPQKGGQTKAEGQPTKAVEPLIQCVHQHEDQTTGVEDQRHGRAARDSLDPVGEPKAKKDLKGPEMDLTGSEEKAEKDKVRLNAFLRSKSSPEQPQTVTARHNRMASAAGCMESIDGLFELGRQLVVRTWMACLAWLIRC